MEFDEFQTQAEKTAVYPGQNSFMGLSYAALGLAGEAGEVADEVKKAWRNDGSLTEKRRQKIILELGDVLYYVSQVATEINASLEGIAWRNVEKIRDRQAKGELPTKES